jgi:hypothetical protein
MPSAPRTVQVFVIKPSDTSLDMLPQYVKAVEAAAHAIGDMLQHEGERDARPAMGTGFAVLTRRSWRVS